MQNHAADQLNVEMAHSEDATRGLASHGEGFLQDVVLGLAARQALAELRGLGAQRAVVEGLEIGLQGGDPICPLAELFDDPVVRGTEHALHKAAEH
jgi:hypothetical protein